MSQDQAGTNAAATRNLAARLEARHFPGDPQVEAEVIVRSLLADGLAPIRRPETIPQRGRGGSDQARADALRATAEAVRAAKDKHPGDTRPEPMAGPRELTRLAILLSEDGVKDRQERLDWCGAMVNRTLASSAELTRTEARYLIATLEVPQPQLPENTVTTGVAAEEPVELGETFHPGEAADLGGDAPVEGPAPEPPETFQGEADDMPAVLGVDLAPDPDDDVVVRRGWTPDEDDEPVARNYGAVTDVDA